MRYMRMALPTLVLILVASNAFAASPGGRLYLQTPEERAQQWQDSFSKFVAEHPELTFEKVQALDDMARIIDRSFFVQAPAKEKRDMLSARLADLGRVLSAYDYQELLASSPKELVRWMKDTEVITDPSTTPNCNCGDAQDCAGGSCQNVTCVHEAGTTHWGRC